MTRREQRRAAACAALVVLATLFPVLFSPAAAAVGVRANAGGSQVVEIGDVVTFDGSRSYTLSGGNLSYVWDFNESDGIQEDATGVIASHLYNESNVFTVTLTVTDGAQSDVDTTSVVVTSSNGTVPGVPNLPPVAIPPLTQRGSQNQSMVFDGTRSFDPNGDNLTYEWDFNELDGLTPNGDKQGPVVNWTYRVSGVFNITMIVSDGNGSDAGRTSAIILPDNGTVIPGVNIPPVAVAEGDQIGVINEPMQFNANRSFDADGDTMNFAWDFDSRDGSTQVQRTGEVVSWTYAVAGEYNVTLTVTDVQGQDTDVLRVFVRESAGGGVPGVGNLPPIVIISSPFPGQRFLPGEPIHFNGSRSFDPEGFAVRCQWQTFNPSTILSSACDMNYAFAEGGIKVVELLVADEQDTTGVNTVTIIVNGSGPVNRQPNGAIEGPATARVGQAVNFTANYTDPDGDELTYSWDFNLFNGIQVESTGRNVSWVFNSTCQCTVTVQVIDGNHRNAPVLGFLNLEILPEEIYPPEAHAGSDTTAQEGQGIVFDGKGNDTDGTITLYEWDLNGNGNYEWQDPNSGYMIYAYALAGSYNACLRVTDNDGLTAIDCRLVTITPAPNNPPTADAGSDKPSETQGVQTFLHGTGSDTDGFIVLFEWDFGGDGIYDWSNSSSGDAFHTYQDVGTYNAALRVTDERGARSTDTVTVSVKKNQPPTANAGSDQFTQAGNTVSFSGAGSRDAEGPITKYQWDFDSSDGLQADSTEIAPAKIYTKGGTYLVTLAVWDQFGQTSSDTAFVDVTQSAGVTLAVDVQNKEVASEQTSSYLLTLINTGDGTDSFSLGLAGDPEVSPWYTLETRQVNNLEAGGVRVVRLSVTVPKVALVSQASDIQVSVQSVFDQAKHAEVTVLTTVKPIVNIRVTFVSFPTELTAGQSTDLTVRVSNLGNDVANVNFAEVTGVSWLTLQSPVPSKIAPSKSLEFQFTLTVPPGTSSGSHPVSVTGKVVNTNVTDTESFTLTVKGTPLPGLTSYALVVGIALVAALLLRARPRKRE